MESKEKNQILEILCKDVNPNEEALVAIYATKENCDHYAIGDMELVSDAVTRILLDGEDKNHVAYHFALAIMRGVYNAIESGLDPDFAMFDDDGDDTEDCAECELLRVCGSDEAVKTRKALGIPKPKKHDREK